MADSNKPIVPGGDTVGTVGEVYLSKNGKTYECVAVIDNTTITPNGETIPSVEYVWVCTDGGGVTTLHINVTAINQDTLQATFTADKTPSEMQQAATTGPIWCVITFAAGISGDNLVTYGIPPVWYGGMPAFGYIVLPGHKENGNNDNRYAVRGETDSTWLIEIGAFGS